MLRRRSRWYVLCFNVKELLVKTMTGRYKVAFLISMKELSSSDMKSRKQTGLFELHVVNWSLYSIDRKSCMFYMAGKVVGYQSLIKPLYHWNKISFQLFLNPNRSTVWETFYLKSVLIFSALSSTFTHIFLKQAFIVWRSFGLFIEQTSTNCRQ